MRNFKTARFAPLAVLIVIAIAPSDRLFAAGELAASGSDTVSEGGTEGIGLGKFFKLPFHVSISVRGGYDDNVATQTFDRQASAFINGILGVSYNFGTPRTQFGLASTFGLTKYLDGPSDIDLDLNPNLNLTLTHRASPRLTLSITSYLTYQQQPDFATFAGQNRRSGSFFFTSDKFSAAYQWKPRFSTVTSYTFGGVRYDDSAVGVFEDRTEHTFGNELRFLVWPTTSLIMENRFGIVAYTNAVAALTRDSTAHYILAGVDHNFSPRINISSRGGVEIRNYDSGGRIAPYAEATLIYALGPHLSLSWVNRYSLEEPDVPGSVSRTTFRSALSARYGITPRISSTLSLFWEHDANDATITPFFVSPAFAEDIFSATVSLRYAVNRNWGADVGYEFADVKSEFRFREYYRNRFYGGVNFQF